MQKGGLCKYDSTMALKYVTMTKVSLKTWFYYDIKIYHQGKVLLTQYNSSNF